MTEALPRNGIEGRHVLLGAAAMFAVVLTANTIFITAAVKTFPGEIVKKSYVQGLHYNDVLAKRDAQTALGWRAQADLAPTKDGAALRIRMTDAAGAPLNGLTLEGALRHPVDEKSDRPLAFTSLGGGLYEAAAPGLHHGQWRLDLKASHGQNTFDIGGKVLWPS